MKHPYRYPHPQPGVLRISGADRIDFLQRQSTNDLQLLTVENYVSTVLTSPAARIIDVLQVFEGGDETLLAVTLPGRGAATYLFLKRRIFFMDKAAIEDLSASMLVVDVEGTGADGIVAALGIQPPGEGRVHAAKFGDAVLRAAGQRGPGGAGFRLVTERSASSRIAAALETAGAHPISDQEYNRLRVEAGIPGPRAELVDTFTPLEVGLRDLVSDSKGCYTGQEIIARQITYDKVTRHLVGLKLESPAEPGSRILVDGSPVGSLTSYAESPRRGHIALAIIKRPHFEVGTQVVVEGETGALHARVTGLRGAT